MNRKPVPIHLRPHPPTQPADIAPVPEPLWRRVKTIERVLNWCGVLPPDQLDDRGVKMSRFSNEHIRCVVQEREPSAKFRALTLLGLSMLGAVLVGYAFMVIRHPVLTAVQTLFLVVICVAVARSAAKDRGRQLGARASTLLESARCGACAQPFDYTSTRGVDYVRCTECGSQWNTQRLDGARASDAFLMAVPKQRPILEELVMASDDRLVHRCFSKPAMKTMKASARETVPDLPQRKKLLARLKARGFGRGLVLSLRWSVPTLAVCWIAAVYAAHISQPTYHEFVSFSLRVCAGIAAVVLIFSGVTAFSHVQTQRYLRDVGLCPTCRGLLDTSAPPEFDGCVRCATCGCLWKHDVVATAPAPNQPTATHPTSAKPNAAP